MKRDTRIRLTLNNRALFGNATVDDKYHSRNEDVNLIAYIHILLVSSTRRQVIYKLLYFCLVTIYYLWCNNTTINAYSQVTIYQLDDNNETKNYVLGTSNRSQVVLYLKIS